MITKERLEKLIKRGGTIYSIFGGLQRVGLKPCENFIKANNLYEIDERKVETNEAQVFIGSLGSLFETKEDAEFALRYQEIPRTEYLEYLDLPTWEEIKNLKDKTIISFYAKDTTHGIVSVHIFRKFFNVESEDQVYLFKKLTKENYIESCELCRKLFLGEKI